MRKIIKLTTLLTSCTCLATIAPVLTSCNKNSVVALNATVLDEYFVGEQITRNDFTVEATFKDGSTKKVTDWTCDVQLPYTFVDSEEHTFIVNYGGAQAKVIKKAHEHTEKITINFVAGEHGSVVTASKSIQSPVKWSAVIKSDVKPDSGYEFDKWVDESGAEISKDTVLRNDTTVTALFKEQPEAEKGLKFVHQHLAETHFFSVEWDGSDSIHKDLVIPSSHAYAPLGEECPVLWVRNFKNCKYIETVTIPSCVNSIGSEAFAYDSQTDYSNLKTVTFETNSQCEEIYSSAFKGCEKLTGITIPKNVTKIGANAFDMSQYQTPAFEKLEFEEGSKLKTISQDAFKNCIQLKSVYLPEGLTTLGGFNGTTLTDITIPDSVTEILDYCFNTNSLSTVTFNDNPHLATIGDSAFKNSQILKFTLPDTVTTIKARAFQDCAKLETFEIGDNSKLNKLGSSGGLVFSGTKISEFTIPATVTIIGASLFGATTNEIELTSLTFKDTEHSWKAGYGSEPETFTPTGAPEADAANFVDINNGKEMNKITS